MNYGSNWPEAREKALSRDGFQCVACGDKPEGLRLVVHHIVPLVRFGNDWERANELSNLVTVCTACHGGLHMLMEAVDEAVHRYWSRGWGKELPRDREVFKVLARYMERME